mmetsp:Transcript_27858/g.70661  ORF Transcript_27858/g.70661 Transcript_27858/m.70661 type:complete len:291 (-) Transcript_27858:130-1002(-)
MLRPRGDHHLLEQRGELIRAHILAQHLRRLLAQLELHDAHEPCHLARVRVSRLEALEDGALLVDEGAPARAAQPRAQLGGQVARAEAVALEALARAREECIARGRADRRLPRGLRHGCARRRVVAAQPPADEREVEVATRLAAGSGESLGFEQSGAAVGRRVVETDAHRDELRGKRSEHGAQSFTWRRAREAAVLVLSKHPAIDGLHLITALQAGSLRGRTREHGADRVAARELHPEPLEGIGARLHVHQHDVAAREREREVHARPPSACTLYCLESTHPPVCQGYPTTR